MGSKRDRVWRFGVSGLLGTALLFASISAFAQDIAGNGGASSSGDPQTVLRGVLVAACAQKQTEFAKALTSRNVDAFAHLTPAAQATLLKRFVLLDGAGEPRVESGTAGVIRVSCVTPRVTTVMEIGKAEIRDNLAYLALTVRDVASADDASVHRAVMGMVRENGQWKLLSLGLLLLDLPTLGEEWDRAESKTNENAALAHVKELAEAIETYRKTYTRLPDDLAALGPAAPGAAPKPDKAALVTEDLASGHKDGYAFRYVIVGSNSSGAPAKYELAAIPAEYGRTGVRSFFRDSSGVLHGADHKGAVGSAIDPKVD